MIKNVTGQKVSIFARDVNGVGVGGDAANITAYISKDGAAPAQSNDVNPAELDGTNMPGVYTFDLTQAETDCDEFILYPKSSTSGVYISLVKASTSNITADSNGIVEANIKQIDGLATNGNNATLKLKQLHIQNTDGDGFMAIGGLTGAGISASGGGTNGVGLSLRGFASGKDIEAKEIDFIKDVMEGDSYIDKTTTPWQYVIHKKGDSGTEYIRKDLKDVDGGDITDVTVAIGKHTEPV